MDMLSFEELESLLGSHILSPVTGSNYSVNGKGVLIIPGNYGLPTPTRTLLKAGSWKISVWKSWGGNGFGSKSYYYLFNTTTGLMYNIHPGASTITQIIARAKERLAVPNERKEG